VSSKAWTSAIEAVPFDEATARLSAQQTPLVGKLIRRLINLRPMRWKTLGTYAKRGMDRVDVEEVVMALHCAGWVEVQYKRDGRGELEPRQLRLVESKVDGAATFINTESPSQRERRIQRLLVGLEDRRDGHTVPVPERVLVRRLFGQTKSVRVREYRTELEAALGVPLEQLVRFHVDTVLTAGPARYRFGDVAVDLRGSSPWHAITEPVVNELTDLKLDGADEVVCVENQTPFEALLYEGMAERLVVVFTAGYLGTVERLWLTKLVRAGVRRIRHWGDLDPWGLDIYRNLRAHILAVDASVDVQPWRMGPAPLERSDTQKLTTEDWVALHRYLKREDAPLRDTALAMKRLGRKLEQEALLDEPKGDLGL
jgi:hypothetical protein